MKPKGTQFEQLPGIEKGPQSHIEDTDYEPGEEWVKERRDATEVDSALHAVASQRHLKQLGETSWGRGTDIKYDAAGPPEQPMQGDIKHLFRGMSEDEFQEAKGRGFIESDRRGTLMPEWEGTNATNSPRTAHAYLPKGGTGRVVKLNVLNEDQWFASNITGYVHTRAQVPWDRVVSATEPIHGPDSPDRPPTHREGVIEAQKKKGR